MQGSGRRKGAQTLAISDSLFVIRHSSFLLSEVLPSGPRGRASRCRAPLSGWPGRRRQERSGQEASDSGARWTRSRCPRSSAGGDPSIGRGFAPCGVSRRVGRIGVSDKRLGQSAPPRFSGRWAQRADPSSSSIAVKPDCPVCRHSPGQPIRRIGAGLTLDRTKACQGSRGSG